MTASTTLLTANPEERVFTGPAGLHVPVTADRYDTKKKAGSSDGGCGTPTRYSASRRSAPTPTAERCR
jgi:hypothetical protein